MAVLIIRVTISFNVIFLNDNLISPPVQEHRRQEQRIIQKKSVTHFRETMTILWLLIKGKKEIYFSK